MDTVYYLNMLCRQNVENWMLNLVEHFVTFFFFFFFHWHYSPLWALACRTMSFHFFLSATNSLRLLTPSTSRSLSTSFFHLFLGLHLLVPSRSWVTIFLGILSSSILSRWPNWLIVCPFIHFTIFSPLLISSSSRFVRIFHSPFSYLGPYILLYIFVGLVTGAQNLTLPPPLSGFDPPTVQPVFSRHTDWAIAAHVDRNQCNFKPTCMPSWCAQGPLCRYCHASTRPANYSSTTYMLCSITTGKDTSLSARDKLALCFHCSSLCSSAFIHAFFLSFNKIFCSVYYL